MTDPMRYLPSRHPLLTVVILAWPLAATAVHGACGDIADVTLGGPAPSTLSGIHTIRSGILAMAKPNGITAVAGDLMVGGGSDQAILRWDASHQVADTASVTLQGPYPARLRMQGHSETMGPLVLAGAGDIALGDGEAQVRFANSSAAAWSAGVQLLVLDWDGALAGGGGGEAICFGASADGLTPAQLEQVRFVNPAGLAPGTYRAAILASGEVVPVDSAFSRWLSEHGLNGADAAFGADPDGDSIVNGIEFVIGGHPHPDHPNRDSRALLPTATRVGNDLVFTYTRRNEAAELMPQAEFSTDLSGPWTTAVDPGNAVIQITPGEAAATVRVSIAITAHPRLFVRLKVTAP